MRAVGLMSGTSLDGVDVALVDIRPRGGGYALELIRFETIPFSFDVRARLDAALPPNRPPPASVATLERELGACFAAAAVGVTRGEPIAFAATHGLTLYHRGEACETMQIGDPYVLRDALSASVVFDFRRADCAAGGNGAPLVPYVDALLFASRERDVVALNIGGIANVTVLRRDATPGDAAAWDTGPGNVLIDEFVRRRTGGAERFDRAGAYAAAGRVDRHALRELIGREAFYLMQPPPKSTGRERFGPQLLDAQADVVQNLTLANGCATLCAYTAATIADSLERYGPAGGTLVVSGGGTHNGTLLRMLAERLEPAGFALVRSSEFGVDPDAKEAIAFAVLGYETLRGRPANVPRATGAARPAVLGAIVPFDLEALLAACRTECASNGGDEHHG
ncbi:MAG: anhydro-N-acetylmuramic acid kinase [Vulcanimicrobiaceae bacterium]